jgi:NAD(P)-dependent dehydrogenase (short-subunit alcohol dehydrogenase family)
MPAEVVVITGGGSGIGRAAAELFLAQGWRVALVDKAPDGLEAARRELGAWTAICDIRDPATVTQTADRILADFGSVEALVNNAGVSQPKRVVELTPEEWNDTIAVNLTGAFLWSRALLPSMLSQQRGRIINISSVSAKHGGGSGTVSKACYAASKAGLLGFTRGLAREAAPHVLVNALCPGMIDTPMTRELVARSGDELRASIPLRRLGTPQDVANMIWVLASPHAAYLTGEIIDVNGGLLID